MEDPLRHKHNYLRGWTSVLNEPLSNENLSLDNVEGILCERVRVCVADLLCYLRSLVQPWISFIPRGAQLSLEVSVLISWLKVYIVSHRRWTYRHLLLNTLHSYAIEEKQLVRTAILNRIRKKWVASFRNPFMAHERTHCIVRSCHI